MATGAVTSFVQEGVIEARWSGLAAGEAGVAATASRWPGKSVHISGTFGGATLAIQGSNDGSNWSALSSGLGAQGDLTGINSGRVVNVFENPKFIRPALTGGDGTTAHRGASWWELIRCMRFGDCGGIPTSWQIAVCGSAWTRAGMWDCWSPRATIWRC